jgi:hypothetical protein
MTCVVSGAGTVRGREERAPPGAAEPAAELDGTVPDGGGAIKPGCAVSGAVPVTTWVVSTPAGAFGFFAQRDMSIWSPIRTAMIRKIAMRVLRSIERAPV